jgi:adenylate cyclase
VVARIDDADGKTVERTVRILVLFATAIANVIGAVAVFVLSVWVIPTDSIDDGDSASTIDNLILTGAYLLFAIPFGTWLVLRGVRSGRAWLRESAEREPTEAEQLNLLRAPLKVFASVGILWLLAAFVFAGFNAVYDLETAQRVGVTVLLGGLTTCAAAYLMCERLLRPAAVRALDARPLEKPALPGVTVRTLLAWALGSGVPMLGVCLIALSTLTEQDFSRTELAIAALSITGVGLIVGFFAIVIAARATAAPIVAVRRAISDVEDGDLDAEVRVYDGTEVGLLQSGFNRMVAGLRERERIRELFGRHVGEDVAQEAIKREVDLGGETREVAVLFVDLIGSTTIAAERPATEVVELLNRFFGVVVDVVDECGGWVNKFEGDAALAIFGAPNPVEDAAGAALAAGRTLAERLDGAIDGAAAGIGVSWGKVVAGNIGSSERFEYTVIGDAVNEAARLCELAKDKPGRLLASAAAVEQAGEEASHWELAEEVELRGRKQPTRLALCEDFTGKAGD